MQVIFVNTLLYPVSVSNYPVPDRGVFYISIIDIISRISLVLFIMFCESNYHYNKVPLKVVFFKCKTIHIILLHIAILQSISIQWIIKTVHTCIIVRYTCGGSFVSIFHWSATILLFLLSSILKCHGTLHFSKISNLFFCGIFKHSFFPVVKEIHKVRFL